jgi:hypothetical protein
MMTTNIIPDIHGQYHKLSNALRHIGWYTKGDKWRPTSQFDYIVFLGDFIDRGSNNSAVLRAVRQIVDDGYASAIMGNHELNAIHFHTGDPETGQPLRSHSSEHLKQHGSFLDEFPLGAQETKEAIAWFKKLPLFLEFDSFRVAHACWPQPQIDWLRRQGGPFLNDEQLIEAGRKGTDFYNATEVVLKGPEQEMPGGTSFHDKEGKERRLVRLAWWRQGATNWWEATESVPEAEKPKLEAHSFDPSMNEYAYDDEKPVFFGHYWFTGTPRIEATNALCLDYSAGKDGPLVAYQFEGDASPLDPQNFRVVSV